MLIALERNKNQEKRHQKQAMRADGGPGLIVSGSVIRADQAHWMDFTFLSQHTLEKLNGIMCVY